MEIKQFVDEYNRQLVQNKDKQFSKDSWRLNWDKHISGTKRVGATILDLDPLMTVTSLMRLLPLLPIDLNLIIHIEVHKDLSHLTQTPQAWGILHVMTLKLIICRHRNGRHPHPQMGKITNTLQ